MDYLVKEERNKMTAKKYVENATSDRLVVFQRDIFKDFVNQLCKEQRELCARRAWSMQYEFDPLALGIEYDQFIKDSQQPQIFEEGK